MHKVVIQCCGVACSNRPASFGVLLERVEAASGSSSRWQTINDLLSCTRTSLCGGGPLRAGRAAAWLELELEGLTHWQLVLQEAQAAQRDCAQRLVALDSQRWCSSFGELPAVPGGFDSLSPAGLLFNQNQQPTSELDELVLETYTQTCVCIRAATHLTAASVCIALANLHFTWGTPDVAAGCDAVIALLQSALGYAVQKKAPTRSTAVLARSLLQHLPLQVPVWQLQGTALERFGCWLEAGQELELSRGQLSDRLDYYLVDGEPFDTLLACCEAEAISSVRQPRAAVLLQSAMARVHAVAVTTGVCSNDGSIPPLMSGGSLHALQWQTTELCVQGLFTYIMRSCNSWS